MRMQAFVFQLIFGCHVHAMFDVGSSVLGQNMHTPN